MKVIISPAKKMNKDDGLGWNNLPVYLDQAAQLLEYLKGLSYDEAKKLWKCNDDIASLNMDRIKTMNLTGDLSPAILTYEGIQYQYMAPGVFEEDSFCWIEDHLRILSGFYGILRPMDGIVPYRLEMQAKTKLSNHKDLYDFWGSLLYEELVGKDDKDHIILNLASKEYSKTIEKYLKPQDSFITCIFAEEVKGKLVQKGTLAKMARGEMVRYLADMKAQEPAAAKGFDRLDFKFREDLSSDTEYVFVKQ